MSSKRKYRQHSQLSQLTRNFHQKYPGKLVQTCQSFQVLKVIFQLERSSLKIYLGQQLFVLPFEQAIFQLDMVHIQLQGMSYLKFLLFLTHRMLCSSTCYSWWSLRCSTLYMHLLWNYIRRCFYLLLPIRCTQLTFVKKVCGLTIE